MSRSYCNVCQRPQVSCICHLICPTKNDTHVVILQHPSEVKQSKGTVTLLSQSLVSCQVLIAEDFSEHQEFLRILADYKGQIALVYPSEQAEIIKQNDEHNLSDNIKCVILLDGTWKKAYRIYMINEVLQKIPHRVLPDNIKGQYQIRKTQKQGALSTLEACCYSLALMENDQEKYTGLLNQFIKFNQMQLSFVVKR